jgi:hypothetical protein
LDLSAAAGLLQGIHITIAMVRGPHWMMNDTDAKAYGQAMANALRHIPITMAQKYFDFTALALAVATYEVPRIAEDIRIRNLPPRQPQQRPAPMGQVFQFAPPAARAGAEAAGRGGAPAASPNPPAGAPAPPPGPPVQPAPDMTYEPEYS